MRRYIPYIAVGANLINIFLFSRFNNFIQHFGCNTLTPQICIDNFDYIYENFTLLNRRRNISFKSPKITNYCIFNFGYNKESSIMNDILNIRIII